MENNGDYCIMHSFQRKSASCTHISGFLHALVALCPPEIATITVSDNDNERPIPLLSLSGNEINPSTERQ